jgi:hypothetical protein
VGGRHENEKKKKSIKTILLFVLLSCVSSISRRITAMELSLYIAINNYLVSRKYPEGDGHDLNSKAKRRIRDQSSKCVAINGILYKKQADGSPGVEILNTGNIFEVV